MQFFAVQINALRHENNVGVREAILCRLSVTHITPEDHWSCIAHLIAEDMLKSAVIEEKKLKNIECK